MNRIQHKNLKLSHKNQTENKVIYKTDEIKCSNRYETLYTDDNDDEFYNSCNSSTSSNSSASSDKMLDEISSDNIQKKKKSKNFNEKEGNENEGKNTVIQEKDKTIKERMGILGIHKNRYYHQPKEFVERIQATISSVVTRKCKIVDSILAIIL